MTRKHSIKSGKAGSAEKTVKGLNDELRVCSLNEMAQEVFEISGFDTILAVFGNELDTLKEF